MLLNYLKIALLCHLFAYQTSIADSDIQSLFLKRANIPDLNEFPPEEEEIQHPNHSQYDLGSTAPVKRLRSQRPQTKRIKIMTNIMQDAKACNHSKSCSHWSKLSKYNKSLQNLINWKKSLVRLLVETF